MPGPDDLAALKAERDAADREYNDALTRLDGAIQQLSTDFPHPPLPRSEEAQDRCVLLPMFASITTDQLFEVAQGLQEACRL